LTEKEHTTYLQQAAKDREEYHKYLERVKKYQTLSRKQRKLLKINRKEEKHPQIVPPIAKKASKK